MLVIKMTIIAYIRFIAISAWWDCIPLADRFHGIKLNYYLIILPTCTAASTGNTPDTMKGSTSTLNPLFGMYRDLNAIQTQEKLERLNRIYAKQREQLVYVSTIKLQSWWRMILGRRLGKR